MRKFMCLAAVTSFVFATFTKLHYLVFFLFLFSSSSIPKIYPAQAAENGDGLGAESESELFNGSVFKKKTLLLGLCHEQSACLKSFSYCWEQSDNISHWRLNIWFKWVIEQQRRKKV